MILEEEDRKIKMNVMTVTVYIVSCLWLIDITIHILHID